MCEVQIKQEFLYVSLFNVVNQRIMLAVLFTSTHQNLLNCESVKINVENQQDQSQSVSFLLLVIGDAKNISTKHFIMDLKPSYVKALIAKKNLFLYFKKCNITLLYYNLL